MTLIEEKISGKVEPIPAPPTPKGTAMRERLIRAAAIAFGKNGYERTRVADIVKVAKTSHGNFYRHFHNKDDALIAVLRPMLDQVYQASRRRRGSSLFLSEEEFVENVAAYFAVYIEHRHLLRVMREAAARGEQASFFTLWMEERSRFIKRTAAWLLKLQQAGEISADIDPTLAAEALGALTEQITYVKIGLADVPPDADSIRRMGFHCAAIWYRGVFGHDRRNPVGRS